jgi:hypothetical protein
VTEVQRPDATSRRRVPDRDRGPLVSLGLGVFFVLLAVFAGLPNTMDGVVTWLGYINLSLPVFNLCRRCRWTAAVCSRRRSGTSEVGRPSRPAKV